MIITLTDVRAAGYCSRGLRTYFAQNNLDWMDFLHNGIDADILATIDDEPTREFLKGMGYDGWKE